MTCMLFFFALLKKRPLRLLLIALCSFGCFFCKLGLGIAADTLVYANDKLIQLCGVGDIELYSETVSCGELEKLLLSLGASEVSEGFRYSLRCSFDDGVERTVRFIALSGDVLKPYIKGDGEFALSYGYSADFNDTLVRKFYLPNGNQIDVSAKAYMPGLNAVYADRLTPLSLIHI